ncbi:helix-turn-helix domain-containing protein [Aestuariibacter halophilus]|uniref:Helix-turn-helix domain-containing protein n=1 Tax=Fluctibacter halophilus TaxID=226011 RepID=A0ABS8G5Z9_9ALTE|nr:helix-turn-helix domain-containing protein [Aestuariibacter halophilus]MCC2615919.1 helix-turn-helix domain-containing protein [Aestuariibacter halophilus]
MENSTPVQKNAALLDSKDTSAETQRQQILSHLRKKQSINTLEFRQLGFMSPAPRIFELKQLGYTIRSVMEDVITPDGRMHRRVARYYLSHNQRSGYGQEEAA